MQERRRDQRARIAGRLVAVQREQQADLVFPPEFPAAFVVFLFGGGGSDGRCRRRGRGQRNGRRGRRTDGGQRRRLRQHGAGGGRGSSHDDIGLRKVFGRGRRQCGSLPLTFKDLQAAAIDADGHDRRRHYSRRRFLALDERQRLIGGHGRVTLGDAFIADAFAQPANLLIGNVQFRETVESDFGLLVRGVVAAGVNNLGQDGIAVLRAIKPQALGLREKKPADICGSNVWVLARPPRRHALPPLARLRIAHAAASARRSFLHRL